MTLWTLVETGTVSQLAPAGNGGPWDRRYADVQALLGSRDLTGRTRDWWLCVQGDHIHTISWPEQCLCCSTRLPAAPGEGSKPWPWVTCANCRP